MVIDNLIYPTHAFVVPPPCISFIVSCHLTIKHAPFNHHKLLIVLFVSVFRREVERGGVFKLVVPITNTVPLHIAIIVSNPAGELDGASEDQ